MEVGRSDMQGHPQLHSNFRANLGYLKDPDDKKKIISVIPVLYT